MKLSLKELKLIKQLLQTANVSGLENMALILGLHDKITTEMIDMERNDKDGR